MLVLVILLFKIWEMNNNVTELRSTYSENRRNMLACVNQLAAIVKENSKKLQLTNQIKNYQLWTKIVLNTKDCSAN